MNFLCAAFCNYVSCYYKKICKRDKEQKFGSQITEFKLWLNVSCLWDWQVHIWSLVSSSIKYE